MRILVSGANGFLGKYLIKNLLGQNHKILAIYNNKKKKRYLKKNLFWLKLNLEKPINNVVKNKIIKFKPEITYHSSWSKIPDFSHEISLNNLNSSINLMKIILKIKTCKKIIVSGSCFENYYDKDKGKSQTNFLKYFVFAKKNLKDYLFNIAKKNNKIIIWLNFFYLYGRGQKKESLIPSLKKNLLEKKKIIIKNPFYENDFIFIEDAIDAAVKCIKFCKKNQIVDIGSGKLVPVWKVLKELEININGKAKFYKKFLLKYKRKKNLLIKANIKKTKKIIKDFNPIKLETGIKKI